jgi:hypothetical protein
MVKTGNTAWKNHALVSVCASRRFGDMKLSRESVLIIAICVADLATTIWFVRSHGAQEANPIMRFFLEQGLIAFILAKAMFCLGPLALIEWARRRNPLFVRGALRAGIALYLGFYGTVVWKINAPTEDRTYTHAEMAAIYEYAAMPVTNEHLAALRTRMVRK